MNDEKSRSRVESPGLARMEDRDYESNKGAWFTFMIQGRVVTHYILDFNIFTGEFITACGETLTLFLHSHSKAAINTCTRCYGISRNE